MQCSVSLLSHKIKDQIFIYCKLPQHLVGPHVSIVCFRSLKWRCFYHFKILSLTLPKKQGKIKKGSEKKCTVYICSFWLQSDLASLFCPCGFIIWGQLVSCPGSAWLVCSLFLSVSVFLVCFLVKPARVLPLSVWLAHQFWMNGVCVPSHHQMSQMMLQPKSSGEGTPHVRTLGLPRWC